MMTAVVGLALFLVLLMLRKSGHSVRYIALTLVSTAALLWAASFDFIADKDVVADALAYKRFLRLSAIGAIAAVAGLIASIWCSDKPVRIFSRCIGAVAFLLCAADIFTPY
jgi:hypothetical protein